MAVTRHHRSERFQRSTSYRTQLLNFFYVVFIFLGVKTANCHARRRRQDDGSDMDQLEPGTFCSSQGQFKFDPVPPVLKAKKAPKETTMSFCTQFKMNTCCNRTHTDYALLRDRQVAAARMNGECRRQTEYVHCSHCHPDVGTKKLKGICKSLCNKWYDACSIEFFSGGSVSALTPCMDTSLICSRLDTIVSSGLEFCERMGYVVFDSNNENACYDGSVPQTIGAPDPSEIKSVFTRYHTNYDQKYAQYIFAVAWTVVIIFTGTCVWMRFFQDTNDDFLSMDDFSPQKTIRTVHSSASSGAPLLSERSNE